MSKILALLSGKGGSGKTTLALSMSSLLADCGFKVLLVDCDLSTNGATYFYENQLNGDKSGIVSFIDILMADVKFGQSYINVKENLNFIPSIKSIDEVSIANYINWDSNNMRIANYFNSARDYNDIIIFDCQAGYTPLLDVILQTTDINLIVIEADAISSSSIRSLYLKTASYLDQKKVFQVFNKVTEEEDKIYSKVSGGTFFTNIGTVTFDWGVRKAFSMAKVPQIDNTSYKYGSRVFELCEILLSDKKYESKLEKYKNKLIYLENQDTKKYLEYEFANLNAKKKDRTDRSIKRLLSLSFALIIVIMMLFITSQNNYISEVMKSDYIVSVFSIMATVLVGIIFTLDFSNDIRERNFRVNQLIRQIEEVDEKIEIASANMKNNDM